MKILLFNTFSAVRGGAETLLLQTTRELLAREHEVSLVVAFDDRKVQDRCPWPTRVNRYYLPELIPPLSDRTAYTQYRRSAAFRSGLRYVKDIIELERADVVHVHNFPSVEFFADVHIDRPLVRTIHAYDTLCMNKLKLIPGETVCHEQLGSACVGACGFTDSFLATRMRAENRVMRSTFTKLLAVSHWMESVLRTNGFAARKISVLPNFTSFMPRGAMATEEPVVLFAGRPTPEKGLRDVVRALSRTQRKPTLLVAGVDPSLRRAPYISGVCTEAEALGVRLELRPWITDEELRQVYERASLVAFGSVWPEPFGLVGIEAMAHGKPVVAFDSGGIQEWLVDGETGFSVPRGDHAAFADRIDQLMDDPQLRWSMGRRAQQVAEERFSPRVHVDRLLEIYNEVRHESPAHRPRRRTTLRDAQRGVGISL